MSAPDSSILPLGAAWVWVVKTVRVVKTVGARIGHGRLRLTKAEYFLIITSRLLHAADISFQTAMHAQQRPSFGQCSVAEISTRGVSAKSDYRVFVTQREDTSTEALPMHFPI